MKTKDLLKYFISESNVFTIEDEEKCGKSPYRQLIDEFNCGFTEIFVSSALVPGDYLVTFNFRGVKPDFIILNNEVERYFTLIEEE